MHLHAFSNQRTFLIYIRFQSVVLQQFSNFVGKKVHHISHGSV